MRVGAIRARVGIVVALAWLGLACLVNASCSSPDCGCPADAASDGGPWVDVAIDAVATDAEQFDGAADAPDDSTDAANDSTDTDADADAVADSMADDASDGD